MSMPEKLDPLTLLKRHLVPPTEAGLSALPGIMREKLARIADEQRKLRRLEWPPRRKILRRRRHPL
jgi:hypothetical protein